MRRSQATPRHNPAPRIHGLDLKQAEAVTRRLLLSHTPTYHTLPTLSLSAPLHQFLNGPGFTALHPSLDPSTRGPRDTPTAVPPARASRKRIQIANLVALVASLPRIHTPHSNGRRVSPPRVLDLCGGCGHVGLVLAALMPQWRVTVVDTAAVALGVAERRAREAGLSNFDTLCKDIVEVDMPFQVAVALHACGGASDVVLAKAAQVGAAVVVAPCCVGGVVAKKGNVTGSAVDCKVEDPVRGGWVEWEEAKSEGMRAMMREGEFAVLARAADFGEHGAGDEWRRVAKMLVEEDRAMWLREGGYQTRLVKMRPLDCTPKNDVLVAWRGQAREWEVDAQMKEFVRGVAEGNVIRGLGVKEVLQVEEILRVEVCESGAGEFWFPPGLGKRRRKIVHAVADSMGLHHQSLGKGEARRVGVRKTAWWPLFFDHYLGVGGPALERVCDELSGSVPQACLERRQLVRGNPRHVTIIRPPEVGQLPPVYKRDWAQLLQRAFRVLQGSAVHALGVGRVRAAGSGSRAHSSRRGSQSGLTDDDFVVEADGRGGASVNEAFFVVLHWPAADSLRRQLGLGPVDFHITLGFTDKDIHTARKDERTLVFRRDLQFCPLSMNEPFDGSWQ
eukprot:GFKZ01010091.1.p1 GENE.GFKZ01010091.1~~GFKZ01010091.1.p1  ORF type:complete len:617 (-),score=74.29 GFKZ01010091.1:1924-3774(-)